MSVFSTPAYDHHERVVFRDDPTSGLRAIIAVHNSNLGPALGGCRMFPYASDAAALDDVLRLSRGMTYKSALAGLPLGGGKAVIMGDPQAGKSRALLLAMGDFVDSLGGRYITAEDSGTSVADMVIMGERTAYVSGVQMGGRFGGDPSPFTAYGVYCGMLAAIEHRLGRREVKGLRVAVQGVGAVGRHLAERLIARGAIVFAADLNADNLQRAQALGAKVVGVDEISGLEVEVFAPCALGASIDVVSLENLRAPVVAGAANNQLASPAQGERLRQRGILYAPDFVINAGGIIDIYHQRAGNATHQSERHIEGIATVLREVFVRADREQRSTESVAESMAEEIFLPASSPIKTRRAV